MQEVGKIKVAFASDQDAKAFKQQRVSFCREMGKGRSLRVLLRHELFAPLRVRPEHLDVELCRLFSSDGDLAAVTAAASGEPVVEPPLAQMMAVLEGTRQCGTGGR